MCAYQVVRLPSPAVWIWTSHGPAHGWSRRTITSPEVAASTWVPHPAARSVPVWTLAHREPRPPQLRSSTYLVEAGSGYTTPPVAAAMSVQGNAELVHATWPD